MKNSNQSARMMLQYLFSSVMLNIVINTLEWEVPVFQTKCITDFISCLCKHITTSLPWVDLTVNKK